MKTRILAIVLIPASALVVAGTGYLIHDMFQIHKNFVEKLWDLSIDKSCKIDNCDRRIDNSRLFMPDRW